MTKHPIVEPLKMWMDKAEKLGLLNAQTLYPTSSNSCDIYLKNRLEKAFQAGWDAARITCNSHDQYKTLIEKLVKACKMYQTAISTRDFNIAYNHVEEALAEAEKVMGKE